MQVKLNIRYPFGGKSQYIGTPHDILWALKHARNIGAIITLTKLN